MRKQNKGMTIVNNILENLVSDLRKRQAVLRSDRNIYTHYLKEVDPTTLVDVSYPHILRGLERQATLVDIVATIGRRVRQMLNLPNDTVSDAQVGWFICIAYIECNILTFRLKYTYKNGKKSKYKAYFLQVKDWKAIEQLWSLIDQSKVDIFPLREQTKPWTSAFNVNGSPIIKKGHPSALSKFRNSDKQALFDTLNKLQAIGWRINKDVFTVYQHFLHNPCHNSPFKLHTEIDEEKKQSLLIEAQGIERLALNHLDNAFYHVYNFDFRGRVYVNTAFLHEQSSDNAKGLLLLDKSTPLGENGLFWLKVHTSNSFGNDKVTLKQRAEFVDENINLFLSYADKPTVNQGWMETDAPFSFLAACYELKKIKNWLMDGNDLKDYPCSLPVYIDGSNNGVQHLVAMSQDEEIAPLVNLVPQDTPGDVYMYIAKYAWKRLEELASQLTQEERDQFDSVYSKAKELQKAYFDAPEKSEQKSLAYAAAQEWRNQNRSIREKLFAVYWLNIDNPKDQRKVVKRNVMTLGYGGTAYGMGQQIIDDTRDMSEYLRDKEHLWGAMLGDLVFETCYEKLKGPATMLRMFQDLADRSNNKDVFLQWTTPVTNFPVVQAYRKPSIVRTKLKYGEEELKVQLQTWEESTIDKDSQRTGAAPNIVHSFDAAHLTMTVLSAPYEMTVVHDSFGTLPGNMDDLFYRVRDQFVEFYKSKPLEKLLAELNCEDLIPDRGNLDVKQILYSDYAFC
jgi:DNA-directed RNA polymerase